MGNNENNINLKVAPLNLKPVALYNNCLDDKNRILSDNKGKAAVYRWINKINGKTYVGSSSNLAARLKHYFSSTILKRNSNHNMLIAKALLKYGHSNFKLEILEYCEPLKCLEREQYYFDILKPEYNILKIAGSSMGVKRSEEAKRLISLATKGINNPNFGKIHSEETKALISLARIGKSFLSEKCEEKWVHIGNSLKSHRLNNKWNYSVYFYN